MRDEYNNFIKEKGIADILIDVNIPYSKKLKYIEILYKDYGSGILNRALVMYKENYIDIGRFNEFAIFNQIKFFCNKLK